MHGGMEKAVERLNDNDEIPYQVRDDKFVEWLNGLRVERFTTECKGRKKQKDLLVKRKIPTPWCT